ncbi:MAG: hypothetical protein K5668_04385 [Lachnospiraceae bacterium]|nr:hypothetical protein [Lachnospiraceae bacterium]
MAVGKSSIKRAMESNGSAKEAAKAPEKKAVTKSVITGTDEQVFATISQDEGINAHYGINTPLPTFLL